MIMQNAVDMGHDITAKLPDSGQASAYLRIGGRGRRQTRIYDALGVPQYNRLDSGSGDSKRFTSLQLANAIYEHFDGKHTLTDDELCFLNSCIQADEGQGIKITFE